MHWFGWRVDISALKDRLYRSLADLPPPSVQSSAADGWKNAGLSALKARQCVDGVRVGVLFCGYEFRKLHK